MLRIISVFCVLILASCQTTTTTPSPNGKPTPGTTEKPNAQTKPALKLVNMPKLGIILGPGAFKSYAHLGVLREFEKMGFKIHGIVGLEWGSLIGAIYSMKGKANDLEWQLSKLKKTDLPQKGNFGSSFQSGQIKDLSKYLDTVFQQSKLEGGAIPFACPSLLLRNGKTAWWQEGPTRPAIEKCLAFPPLYTSTSGWVASAFDVSESAKKLREMGSEIVVFVNVLARGNVLKEARLQNQDESEIIWWDGVNSINAIQSGLDWIVGVHTRNYDILDFEARQSFVLFGQEFGSAAAKKIAEQYGL
jgi:predicted acylesterase/phospholipase RssA